MAIVEGVATVNKVAISEGIVIVQIIVSPLVTIESVVTELSVQLKKIVEGIVRFIEGVATVKGVTGLATVGCIAGDVAKL